MDDVFGTYKVAAIPTARGQSHAGDASHERRVASVVRMGPEQAALLSLAERLVLVNVLSSGPTLQTSTGEREHVDQPARPPVVSLVRRSASSSLRLARLVPAMYPLSTQLIPSPTEDRDQGVRTNTAGARIAWTDEC
jgi:hypothetical protein